MKNIATILLIILAWSPGILAQDISINILEIPASITTGGNGQIQVDVCNNAATPNTALGAYRIVATVTTSSHLQITGTTSLPTGWAICSSTAQSISISNGSDAELIPSQCRTFFINVKAGSTTSTGSDLNAEIAFAGGTDGTKCITTSTLSGDITGNNNSKSAVAITAPLPVTLIRFDAKKEERAVQLTWTTTAETGSDFFEVQQSNDSKSWKPVGEVKSGGESNTERQYQFADKMPGRGMNYYRLRMVDKDGSYAYSSIRSVNFNNQSPAGVYPNPASSMLSIDADNWENVEKLEIIRADGQTVYSSGKMPDKNIDVKSLANGTYIVRLIRKDGSTDRLKAVIVR